MRRQPRDALNLRPRIRLCVPRVPVVVLLLFPFAKVYAPRQLADDGEVDAAADGFFEGGDGGEGVGGEVARAEVAKGIQFFTELEEALFRADGACSVFLRMGKRGVSVGSAWKGGLYEKGRGGRARRTGPPIAPKRTASAFLAAARASSVRGEPVASMDA